MLAATIKQSTAKQSPAAQLATLLKDYKTYQAYFYQKTFDNKNVLIKQSEGRVMLSRPGKFRWEVTKPDRELIVANGKSLWIYNALLQQATKKTLDPANNTSPAALLTGDVNKLLSRFTVMRIDRGTGAWFSLTPKKGTPKAANSVFQMIQIYFVHGRLHYIGIKNSLGQWNRFVFTQVKLNPKLSDTLFQFKPPAGVDVLSS